MIFFLVLFSFSIAKTDKAKTRKYEESLVNIQKAFGGKLDKKQVERAKAQDQEDKVADKLKESMANNQMSNLVQIDSNEHRVRLVLTEAVLFDSGKADLRGRAKDVLKSIAEELKKLPNEVQVEGHTDNVPIATKSFQDNWDLSTAIATSIVRILAKDYDVDPNRIIASGRGQFHPVKTNDTAEGRAGNRRTEIILSPDLNELYKLLYQ